LIDDTYYNFIIVMAAELVRAAESESESEDKPEKLRWPFLVCFSSLWFFLPMHIY